MSRKLSSLSEAAALVRDGETITIGGSLLQRVPAAFVRELARQGRSRLELVKPSPGYDADLLAAAGCIDRIKSGIVLLEPFGLAPNFRSRVERGDIRVTEHACPTIVAGLRAAELGIPFQPVGALAGTEIRNGSDFLELADPRSGATVYAVGALRPDWAIVHVPVCDERGNARVYGSPFWDRVMTRAARGVILTTEEIVSSETLAEQPELTLIPELLVHAVVHVPQGAQPTSCYPRYGVDDEGMSRYIELSQTETGLRTYLDEMKQVDDAAPHFVV